MLLKAVLGKASVVCDLSPPFLSISHSLLMTSKFKCLLQSQEWHSHSFPLQAFPQVYCACLVLLGDGRIFHWFSLCFEHKGFRNWETDTALFSAPPSPHSTSSCLKSWRSFPQGSEGWGIVATTIYSSCFDIVSNQQNGFSSEPSQISLWLLDRTVSDTHSSTPNTTLVMLGQKAVSLSTYKGSSHGQAGTRCSRDRLDQRLLGALWVRPQVSSTSWPHKY